MMLLISIIIPHRNTPEKLQHLLNSIPESPCIEVIVVDDNSDVDHQADQLQFEYPHVRFFANPGPDHNAGSARNYGLDRVCSEWVVFADADDCFVEGGLQAIVGSIRSLSPVIDIVFFGTTSRSERTGNAGFRHERNSEALAECLNEGSEIGVRYRWPGPIAKAIRVELIRSRQLKFDSVIASNDVIFSLMSGHYAREVRCVDSVVYCITESEDSLTAMLTPERALSRLDALIRKNDNLMQWGIDVRLDWGVTFFLKSQPQRGLTKKASIYYRYLRYLIKKTIFNFERVKRHGG